MVAGGRKILRNLQRVALLTKEVRVRPHPLDRLTPTAQPLLPRQLTLAARTIGIPGFFRARQAQAVTPHAAFARARRFSLPAGTAAGLGVLELSLRARRDRLTDAARTVAHDRDRRLI
jgi:hypothetical protein